MKMGILGAGGIARKMAGTIREMPKVTSWAVASRSLEKAKKFADEYGIQRAYGSYEELVSDPEVELIYIATPHSHHYEHIKLCLNHGKHVLSEKAFTQNAKQAKEVLALAKEKRLLLAEAIWTRYMPMREIINQVAASGIIGRPTSLYANLSYPIMDVERMQEPSLAGGALLDIGVYPINFASMVFGNEIEEVKASAVLTDKGVDSMVSLTFIYKDGRMAVLHANAQAVSNREGAIYGEKGYMLIRNVNNCEGIWVYDKDYQLIAVHEAPKQISGYEYEVEACMEAIEKGELECPQMPHREILYIMELMDSIRKQIGVIYPGEEL